MCVYVRVCARLDLQPYVGIIFDTYTVNFVYAKFAILNFYLMIAEHTANS